MGYTPRALDSRSLESILDGLLFFLGELALIVGSSVIDRPNGGTIHVTCHYCLIFQLMSTLIKILLHCRLLRRQLGNWCLNCKYFLYLILSTLAIFSKIVTDAALEPINV